MAARDDSVEEEEPEQQHSSKLESTENATQESLTNPNRQSEEAEGKSSIDLSKDEGEKGRPFEENFLGSQEQPDREKEIAKSPQED